MQATMVEEVFEALRIGAGFLWTAAWAIIMGLAITSLVQVYVSRGRMAQVLGDGGLCGLTKATAFGAASSGCSFGAVAIGKGLFKKGAHAVNFLAFMFASTNLIVELGLMILILLGREFLVAELLGGLILIAVMAVIVHLTLFGSVTDRVLRLTTRPATVVKTERLSAKELSEACDMSLPTVSRRVSRLVEQGLLEKYTHVDPRGTAV